MSLQLFVFVSSLLCKLAQLFLLACISFHQQAAASQIKTHICSAWWFHWSTLSRIKSKAIGSGRASAFHFRRWMLEKSVYMHTQLYLIPKMENKTNSERRNLMAMVFESSTLFNHQCKTLASKWKHFFINLRWEIWESFSHWRALNVSLWEKIILNRI